MSEKSDNLPDIDAFELLRRIYWRMRLNQVEAWMAKCFWYIVVGDTEEDKGERDGNQQ